MPAPATRKAFWTALALLAVLGCGDLVERSRLRSSLRDSRAKLERKFGRPSAEVALGDEGTLLRYVRRKEAGDDPQTAVCRQRGGYTECHDPAWADWGCVQGDLATPGSSVERYRSMTFWLDEGDRVVFWRIRYSSGEERYGPHTRRGRELLARLRSLEAEWRESEPQQREPDAPRPLNGVRDPLSPPASSSR